MMAVVVAVAAAVVATVEVTITLIKMTQNSTSYCTLMFSNV